MDSNAAEVAAALRSASRALRKPDLNAAQQAAKQVVDRDVVADLPRRMFSGMPGRGEIEARITPLPVGFNVSAINSGALVVLSSGRQSGRHGRTRGKGTVRRIAADMTVAVDAAEKAVGDQVEAAYGS